MKVQTLTSRFYDYSLHLRGYSEATIRRYRHVLDFYQKYGTMQEVQFITHVHMRELFFLGRADRKWKATTYLVFYNSLKVFFQWCILEGIIYKNPIEGIEVPKIEQSLPKNLTKQNAFFLLETIQNYPHYSQFIRYRNHAIFSMYIFAGLRKQELLNLKLADVDVNNLTILIRKGKGNKDRLVPMAMTLRQTLKAYQEQRNKVNKTSQSFFLSSTYNAGLTSQGLKLITEQYKKATGIEFTIHRLRHTFATLMIEGGADIYGLSRMMGHSDIKTTTKYLFASADHLRSQMTKHPLNNL